MQRFFLCKKGGCEFTHKAPYLHKKGYAFGVLRIVLLARTPAGAQGKASAAQPIPNPLAYRLDRQTPQPLRANSPKF